MRRGMKKAGVLLGAVLIAGCLAACGGKSADTQSDPAKNAGEVTESQNDVSSESSAAAEVSGAEKPQNDGDGAESSESSGNTEGGQAEAGFQDRANADTGEGEVKILQEGDVAPDFTADLVDGSKFHLSDYDDGVVILNFFATWCGPCVREMPAFGMLQDDEYTGLAILCVDCMEDRKTVDAFVSKNGFTFPIAYDEAGSIGNYYPTDGIPYTLIINKGVIAKIYLGAQDAETQYREYKGAIDACME